MIDHLVFATPDVETTVNDLAQKLGVMAEPGGRHLGFGTRNALLSLGTSYLEILGPDDAQHRPVNGYWYGVENIGEPRLETWTVQTDHVARVAAHAYAAGYDPGDVHKVFRETPAGEELSFRLTLPTGAGEGLIPNLIEWDEGSPHPSVTAPQGVQLLSLRGYHPTPESLRPMLAALGVDLEIRPGDTARLVAVLDSPLGPIELG